MTIIFFYHTTLVLVRRGDCGLQLEPARCQFEYNR